jgi:hypothetical protein
MRELSAGVAYSKEADSCKPGRVENGEDRRSEVRERIRHIRAGGADLAGAIAAGFSNNAWRVRGLNGRWS